MSVDEPVGVRDRPDIEVVYLDLDKVHPNPWNPNVQNARTYEAERESIKTFGFIVPMLLRTHPEKKGEWQIIDGEHRRRGALEEGLTRGPGIVVDDYSEAEVKKLTLALNMHGDADMVPLGRLLVELQDSFDNDLAALRNALPYDSKELEELLKIGAVDWGDFNNDGQSNVEDFLSNGNSGGSKFSATLGFDQAQRERYDAFHEILARELGEAYTPEEAVLSALSGACQQL